MFGLKQYVYVAVIAAVTGAVYYSLNTWHYAPLREKDLKIEHLESALKTTGDKLNECYMRKPKESVEAFIEGVESHESNISVDLGNLHT